MNDGIGDDAESDPAPDAVRSFVERSAQPVAAFENADTTFTAGAPFLKLFEPTLLLPLFACSAFGVVAGNRDVANSHLLGFGFVRGREESGICGHELRYTSEQFDSRGISGEGRVRSGKQPRFVVMNARNLGAEF